MVPDPGFKHDHLIKSQVWFPLDYHDVNAQTLIRRKLLISVCVMPFDKTLHCAPKKFFVRCQMSSGTKC